MVDLIESFYVSAAKCYKFVFLVVEEMVNVKVFLKRRVNNSQPKCREIVRW